MNLPAGDRPPFWASCIYRLLIVMLIIASGRSNHDGARVLRVLADVVRDQAEIGKHVGVILF